jgi:hypothetical protein
VNALQRVPRLRVCCLPCRRIKLRRRGFSVIDSRKLPEQPEKQVRASTWRALPQLVFQVQFSGVKLEIDGKNDFRSDLTLAALPCHLRPVSHVDRIAVTVWATPVPAQNVDHLKTIGTKPLTLIHLLHFPVPFAPSFDKAETRNRLAHWSALDGISAKLRRLPACFCDLDAGRSEMSYRR